MKWVKIMNKKDCLSLLAVLLLSFLYIVLLDDYYKIGLDSLMILFGVLPIFVGINSSFTYVNLGLGLTRKQISNNLLYPKRINKYLRQVFLNTQRKIYIFFFN